MTVTLYYYNLSPFSRAVLMAVKALGLDLKLVVVNSVTGETKKPEFLAINPVHTVPTLKDGDFVLWESKAIITYLVTKYGKDDTLYPTNPQKRAEVDKLLYFDEGTLFSRFGKTYFPLVFGLVNAIDPANLEKLQEALGFLNMFLEGKKYVTGDNVTVADWALVTSVASMEAAGVEISQKNVNNWLKRCKKLHYYAEAQEGIENYGGMIKSKINA